jgi:hypothetical protein
MDSRAGRSYGSGQAAALAAPPAAWRGLLLGWWPGRWRAPHDGAALLEETGAACIWGGPPLWFNGAVRCLRCQLTHGSRSNPCPRNAPPRPAPLPPAPRPHSTQQAVVEYFLLLRVPSSTAPAKVQEFLDTAWSLQFMVPAIMCAAVGAVAGGQQDGGGGGASFGPFTHFVHLRLAQRAALAALRANPLHAALLREAAAPLIGGGGAAAAGALVELAFEGFVPLEIEGMFRRGGEYAEGCEALLLLGPPASGDGGNSGGGTPEAAAAAAAASGGPDEAGGFLSRLAAFAAGPGLRALQTSRGDVVLCSSCSSATAPTHALMARFTAREAAAAFLASPPCAAAALRDPRLPLHLLASVVARVEPGEEGATRRRAI